MNGPNNDHFLEKGGGTLLHIKVNTALRVSKCVPDRGGGGTLLHIKVNTASIVSISVIRGWYGLWARWVTLVNCLYYMRVCLERGGRDTVEVKI